MSKESAADEAQHPFSLAAVDQGFNMGHIAKSRAAQAKSRHIASGAAFRGAAIVEPRAFVFVAHFILGNVWLPL